MPKPLLRLLNKLYKRRAAHTPPQPETKPLSADRYLQALDYSLELVHSSSNPDTVIFRYDTALDMTDQIVEHFPCTETAAYARDKRDYLIGCRDEIALQCIDRCRKHGKLWSARNRMLEDDLLFDDRTKRYLTGLLEELAADSAPPLSGIYIYCRVSFPGSSRIYHYITEDNKITAGDTVLVPVGDHDTSTATVRTVSQHTAEDAPYPPGMTKRILYKC